jgi:hypothetical protein
VLEKILLWLAQAVLNWALAKGQKKLLDLKELAEQEKADELAAIKNAEKYSKAKDRHEKIKAATDLLNGVTP